MGSNETQYLSSDLPRELEMVWAAVHHAFGRENPGEGGILSEGEDEANVTCNLDAFLSFVSDLCGILGGIRARDCPGQQVSDSALSF